MVGDYELLERLGGGGMGEVFRARHARLGRLVALKALTPRAELNPRSVERFFREASALGQVEGPGVLPIYETGVHEGRPWIAMRLVRGSSLEHLLRQEQPFPESRAAEICEEIAHALSAAHETGVIHRDVKRSNIVVEGTPESARVSGGAFLVDFGLAQFAGDETITASGEVLGTPRYMSPEQAMGGDVAAATDAYSLGATLYALLAGRPPCEGSTPLDILDRVRGWRFASPRRLNPSVSRDAETICQKAMAWDPRARYPTAAAMPEDLRRLRERRPILARRATVLYRTRLQVRRNPRAVCFTVLAALILAFLGATFERSFRRSRLLTAAADQLAAEEYGVLAATLDQVPWMPWERQRESMLRFELAFGRGALREAAGLIGDLPRESRREARARIEESVEDSLDATVGLRRRGMVRSFRRELIRVIGGLEGLLRLGPVAAEAASTGRAWQQLVDCARRARQLTVWHLAASGATDAALSCHDRIGAGSLEGRDVLALLGILERSLLAGGGDAGDYSDDRARALWTALSRPRDPASGEDGGAEGRAAPEGASPFEVLDLYSAVLTASQRVAALESLELADMLEEVGSPISLDAAEPAFHLTQGDIDGDGRDEILLVTSSVQTARERPPGAFLFSLPRHAALEAAAVDPDSREGQACLPWRKAVTEGPLEPSERTVPVHISRGKSKRDRLAVAVSWEETRGGRRQTPGTSRRSGRSIGNAMRRSSRRSRPKDSAASGGTLPWRPSGRLSPQASSSSRDPWCGSGSSVYRSCFLRS